MTKQLIIALVTGLAVGILAVLLRSVLEFDISSTIAMAFIGAIAGITSVIFINILKKK